MKKKNLSIHFLMMMNLCKKIKFKNNFINKYKMPKKKIKKDENKDKDKNKKQDGRRIPYNFAFKQCDNIDSEEFLKTLNEIISEIKK